MDTFFTPVYRPPTQEEIKLRKPKNHHHYPNDQPQHHPHPHPAYHSQDDESHSYANLVGNDENPDDSQAHQHQNHHRRHRQADHLHENIPNDYPQPRHPRYHHHLSQESEVQSPQLTRVTLSRASSSSLSSSSSSSLYSSYSWHTEASASDPFSACPAQRPQHSLSCSNILEVRTGFRQDGGSEPIVFATVKRGVPEASPYDRTEVRSRQNERTHASLRDRGQSHSDEGLLQTSEDEVVAGRQRCAARPHHGALYKTASLGRSLAFSEESLVLGAPGRPRRGVFTNQIPSKGILKNREPQPDIRKARSMEVLSPRVANGHGKGGDKGKRTAPAEIQTARESFVQGKLQFSAFLDEITKQVISPSNLNILGVNQGKTPGETPGPVRGPGAAKPQLPIKKHGESCSRKEREQHPKPPAAQARRESGSNSPSYHSTYPDQSDPDKLTSYVARRHRGTPPLHPHPQTSSHHPHPGGNRKEGKSPVIAGHKARESDIRRGSHLTDGTITSPEPILPKQRNHRKHRNISPRSPPPPHPQHLPHIQLRHGYTSPGHQEEGQGQGAHKTLGSALGHESEPGSCKSDSSQTRDTSSTSNSHNSDQSVHHRSHAARKGHTDPHHKRPAGGEHRSPSEPAADYGLHREPAGRVKQNQGGAEPCQGQVQKSCGDSHRDKTDQHPAGGTLAHHGKEEMNQPIKYVPLVCVSIEAQRTIAALETINVPCLIKELLEKHFDSAEAVQTFLKTATTVSHPKTPSLPDLSDPGASNVVEAPSDWLTESEAAPGRVTAFMPWKQEASAATASADSGGHGASQSQPFSIADISAAICKKITSEIAANHRSPQPMSPRGCPEGTNHTSTAGPPAHVRPVLETAELATGHGEVTYLSAQQVLDEFMNQLHSQNKASDGMEQQPHMSTSYE
ncbi:unnamed protein product [Lota lota]